MEDKKLSSAIYQKAVGCETTEVVEEYQKDNEDGDIVLVKKKVTTKYLPPDMTAARTYLAISGEGCDNLSKMTDTELKQEKLRLLNILKEMEDQDGDSQDDTQGEM